jgi:hypothetical protein
LEQDKKESGGDGGKNRTQGIQLVVESFLRGYRNENGSQNIARARSIRYFAPFVLIMHPKMTAVVRDALKRSSLSLP